MTLKVVSFCSYLVAGEYPPEQNAFEAGAFIKAIKGKKVNGYAWLSMPGRKARLKLTDENKEQAFKVFGRMAYAWLEESENVKPPLVIVPVPNSSSTVGSKGRPRTALLADALAAECGTEHAEVVDALRWKEDLGATHSGSGSRNVRKLHSILQSIETFEKGCRVVLVDDVKTTGAHLRAAEAMLRRKMEAVVPLALCAGRAVHLEDVPEDCLVPAVDVLEDFDP